MDITAVDAYREELHRLERDLAHAAANDPKRLRDLMRRHAVVAQIISSAEKIKACEKRVAEAEEILRDPGHGGDLGALAAEEIEQARGELARLMPELRRLLVPQDADDSKNTIIEIRAGTGGEEASLFAAEMYRMYTRYAERKGWKVDAMNTSYAEMGGLKEVVFSVEGEDVYAFLRHEGGVHRVQRVPATESSGRIHTSAATVAVLPEAEEVEVEIKPEEVRVDVYRSSGPGGQSVNTTDSAVRLTHVPTGVVVTCQDEKSQLKNKSKAMRVLRSRLLERARDEAASSRAQERRSMVRSGDRSDKIRTYNFPQNRVTDHRIGLTIHALEKILDGDLEQMIGPLMEHEYQEKLKQHTAAVAERRAA